MSTNTTVVEVVKFVAGGLDEITARTKVYAQQVDEATARNKALMGVMNDPRYQQHAARVTQLNRQYDQMSAKLRNATRAADLQSGAFARNAQVMAKLNAESAQLGRREQLQTLIAEHGKFGGTLRANAEQLGVLKNTAMVGYGAVTGLAMGLVRSGLAGTVQGYQLEMAWTRMGRQAAAVAIPAVDMLSKTVGWAAGKFEKMSGGTQDMILKFGLLAVAGPPVIAMLLRLKTIAGAAGGLIGMGGLMGGRLGGAALGLGGIAALGAIGSETGSGGRLATMGIGAAYGAYRAPSVGVSRGGGALRGAGAVALASVAYDAATGGHYDRTRAKGNNKLISGLAAIGGGVADLFTGGEFGEYHRRKEEAAGKDKARRDVSLNSTALLDAGGAFQAVQEEVLKVTAAAGLDEMTPMLAKIIELMEKYTAALPPPPKTDE